MTFNKQTAHSTSIFANVQLLKIDDIRQLQLLTHFNMELGQLNIMGQGFGI